MPRQLCVPNISEGRDLRWLAATARTVAEAGPAELLDWSADPDHHRAVLSLVGEPDGLHTALDRLTAATLGHVDLVHHRGAHPRLGAVDVVPFVPLDPDDMAVAIDSARTWAESTAARYSLPVFLYGEAALRPGRERPASLRRLGLEQLAPRLGEEAYRPDFGPREVDPRRGVCCVGARDFLVAFNVVLASDDLAAAKAIAAAIRATSGGLPGVQALGMALPSRRRAQVSTNLIDLETTGLQRVYDAIHTAARRRGIVLEGSEIVGTVPDFALRGISCSALGLPELNPRRIVPTRR